MKLVSLFVIIVTLGVSACQTQKLSDEAVIDKVAAETKKEQDKQHDKEPNPVKCQQAKLDLVEAEGAQDVARVNLVKASIMKFCDNIE